MEKGYHTTEVSYLIGSFPLTNFKQRLKDVQESIYASNKQYPLGKTRPPNIPEKAANSRFGYITPRGDSACNVIRPSNSILKISKYREDFNVSNQSTVITDPAGVTSNCSLDEIKQIFTPYGDGKRTKILPFVANQKKLNLRHEPEKTETNCPPSIIVGEDRTSGHFDSLKVTSKLRAKEQNLVEVLWNLLKIKNHCNFQDFTTAFKTYDQRNTGKITAEDIQAMCLKFDISVSMEIIRKLVSQCDILDKDGMINYREFVHCLNWKDLLPERPGRKVEKYTNCWRQGINNPPEDVIDCYKTVASSIGEHYLKVPPKTAGVPTIRSDKVAPRLQKVADFQDYGDLNHASGVIQPSMFAEHGVYETDLAELWSKKEIMNLLKNCGYMVKEEILDSIWNNADSKPSLGAALHTLKQKCF